MKYAKLIPSTKKIDENNIVKNMEYPCFPSNAGEINRQNWNNIIGNPIIIPPNNAIESLTENILVTFNTWRFIPISNEWVGETKKKMSESP